MFSSQRRGVPFDKADHHKHMDYVQAAITRLAGNSFLLKGWCLTLTSALLGFALTRDECALAALGTVAVLAFWYLDSYFLRRERAFRLLFRDVAGKKLTAFKMDPSKYLTGVPWWRVMFSASLSLFYGVLILVSIVTTVMLLSSTSIPDPEKTPVAALWQESWI